MSFHSPSSSSSDFPSSSLCSLSRMGVFLMQYRPSFCMAGATSQSRRGTSMIRSHRKGSAKHRSPSSRSMTCVILCYRRESQREKLSSLLPFMYKQGWLHLLWRRSHFLAKKWTSFNWLDITSNLPWVLGKWWEVSLPFFQTKQFVNRNKKIDSSIMKITYKLQLNM